MMNYNTLKKVVYLNLDRHQLRRQSVIANLADVGVPADKIKRFRGIDAGEYKSRAEIVEAAITDGFPEMVKCNNVGHAIQGNCGYYWSIRRLLRWVKTVGTCLVMCDDAQLCKKWEEYEQLVKNAGEFDIIQLGIIWEPDKSKVYAKRVKEGLATMPRPTVCSFDDRFIHGMPHVGEYANIYSAEGAAKILDALSKRPYVATGIQTIGMLVTHGCVFRHISVRNQHDSWARLLSIEGSYLAEVNLREEKNKT